LPSALDNRAIHVNFPARLDALLVSEPASFPDSAPAESTDLPAVAVCFRPDSERVEWLPDHPELACRHPDFPDCHRLADDLRLDSRDCRLPVVYHHPDFRDFHRLVDVPLPDYPGYRRLVVCLHLGCQDYLRLADGRRLDFRGCHHLVACRYPAVCLPTEDDTVDDVLVVADANRPEAAWADEAADSTAGDSPGENRDSSRPTNKDCRSTENRRNKRPCHPNSYANRNNPNRRKVRC
jgi:hypothetical protein